VWLAATAMIVMIAVGSGCSGSGATPATSANTYMIGVQGAAGTLTETTTIVLSVT